jgi:hypothetical protein
MDNDVAKQLVTDLHDKAETLVESVLWFLGGLDGPNPPVGVLGYRMLWSKSGGDEESVDVFHLYVIRARSLGLFEYSTKGELISILIPLSRITRVTEHHIGNIIEGVIEVDSDVRRSVATGVIVNRQIPIEGDGAEDGASEPGQLVTMQVAENRAVYALAESVTSDEAGVLQIFLAALRSAIEALD